MGGTFGGYTRWCVVFLIIFVLFFLLVPDIGWGAKSTTGMAVTSYTGYASGHAMGGAIGPMGGGMGSSYGYESPSSS